MASWSENQSCTILYNLVQLCVLKTAAKHMGRDGSSVSGMWGYGADRAGSG